MCRVKYRVIDGTLVIDLGKRMKVLSSAPCDGGLRSTRYILNHQVEANSVSVQPTTAGGGSDRTAGRDDPATTLRLVAARFGINE
jgi:hypothetical protein